MEIYIKLRPMRDRTADHRRRWGYQDGYVYLAGKAWLLTEALSYLEGKWHCPPLLKLRRKLLTRCAWCGGKSTKTNPIIFGIPSEHGERWWQGERGMYHAECSKKRLQAFFSLTRREALLVWEAIFEDSWHELSPDEDKETWDLFMKFYHALPEVQHPRIDERIAEVLGAGTER